MINRLNPPIAQVLAAELEVSYNALFVPHFESSEVQNWIEAVSFLLDHNRLDVGEYALRHLRARFPVVRCAGRLGVVFDNLPLDDVRLPFEDDATKDVQIVPRMGAPTVLLLFSPGLRIGLPMNLMHRWTGRLNASLIYLRDFHNRYYLRGVRSLGPTREATLVELRRIIASLGASRIACYGNSAAIFAALHYGLDLGAEAVACVGGSTNYSPEFNAYLTLKRKALKLRAEFPDAILDTRQLYVGAARPPQVRIIYGNDYWNDRIHAEHMGDLPCVTLQPLAGFDGHNAITELIARQQFDELLQWLAPPVPLQRSDERMDGKPIHGERNSIELSALQAVQPKVGTAAETANKDSASVGSARSRAKTLTDQLFRLYFLVGSGIHIVVKLWTSRTAVRLRLAQVLQGDRSAWRRAAWRTRSMFHEIIGRPFYEPQPPQPDDPIEKRYKQYLARVEANARVAKEKVKPDS